ncbi:hypothetical protein GCM10020229_79780 [Kitasatospora albolonga]|uniref:hypothetical protein n=1 Tax=Kitasatospora albolonga TaxID=68173 RepID=UPI0031F02E63
MGVVLPDELAWVLDLIGVNRPNVNEARAAVVAALMGTTADTTGTAYFLEAQSEA